MSFYSFRIPVRIHTRARVGFHLEPAVEREITLRVFAEDERAAVDTVEHRLAEMLRSVPLESDD